LIEKQRQTLGGARPRSPECATSDRLRDPSVPGRSASNLAILRPNFSSTSGCPSRPGE